MDHMWCNRNSSFEEARVFRAQLPRDCKGAKKTVGNSSCRFIMHPLIDGWCRVGNVDGINDRGKKDLSWLRKNGEGHLVVAGEYTHRMATKAHTTVGMSQIEKSRAEIMRPVGWFP